MTTELLVAVLSLAGTALGSIVGILTANRLVIYRIEQLEIKMNKHNCLIERMTVVEESTKSAHKRIDGIKEDIH